MLTDAPPNRKTFQGDWDEIDYLHGKILYWFYERGDARRAARYTERLESLLKRNASRHESIMGEECWSLLHEVRGELRTAAKHREREIELIKRLWQVSEDTPGEEYALQGYGVSDLADRLVLLAVLYHDLGDVSRAIALLVEAKYLCQSHDLEFDGESLLDGYVREKYGTFTRKPGESAASHDRAKNSAASGLYGRARVARRAHQRSRRLRRR